MATRLRNNFLTGLIICAPMAITIYLTWTFIRWADSWVKPYLPDRYNPEAYLKFAVPGTGLLIAILFITLVGFLGRNLIGRSIVDFGERIFDAQTTAHFAVRAFLTFKRFQGAALKFLGEFIVEAFDAGEFGDLDIVRLAGQATGPAGKAVGQPMVRAGGGCG